MNYWKTYAHIQSDVVQNIAVYAPEGAFTLANDQAHILYGDRAFAVDVTQIPVAIGDVYNAGRFYRNNEQVMPLPTDEEEINSLNTQVAQANSVIEDTQIALVEIYEMIGG